MKRYTCILIVAASSLCAAWLLGGIVPMPLPQLAAQIGGQGKPEAKAAKQELDASQQAVMANIRSFTEALNSRDVVSLLKLFADDCVLTESDGTTVTGLKALEESLKESFESDPDAKLSINVDALRTLAPGVIIEEGRTAYYPDGKTLTAETEYQAAHVKKGDQWLITRVRSFNRTVVSPYDKLRELDWLVGDWVDEASDSVIESSYRWDANKAFLLQEFSVRVKGRKVLSGTQRLGRDPLSKQIKGWVFDSEGGYGESLWSSDDDVWTIKLQGVRADGRVVTATNQITRIGNDRFKLESADRTVGDEKMPAFSSIVARKAPAPGR